MDLKDTYNKIAKEWFNSHKDFNWRGGPVEKFASFFKPSARILDAGCGAGLRSRDLVDQKLEVVGLDFSEKMIELAKEYCPEAEFLVKDITKPLELGLFDGIFAQAVLLHIPKKQVSAVLKKLLTNLKPGGYLYVSVKEIWPDGQEEKVIRQGTYGYQYERFFSFFTMSEIRKYLVDLSLAVVHEDKIIDDKKDPWLIVIAKKD